MQPYNPYELQMPPMSGLFGMGNSLTAQGTATEPIGVNGLPMDPQKKQMIMAMMGQHLAQAGQQKGTMPTLPNPVDLYGRPVL